MRCVHRLDLILSSEGVLGGMEFEPMLTTPREKSPLPGNVPKGGSRDTVDSEPKHYQLSYSGPNQQYDYNAFRVPIDLFIAKPLGTTQSKNYTSRDMHLLKKNIQLRLAGAGIIHQWCSHEITGRLKCFPKKAV